MIEADIRRWLKALYANDPTTIVQPIESHATLGVPDVFLCTRDADAWIELKIAPYTPLQRGYVQPRWRPKQLEWLHKYDKAGGVALLFVGYEIDDGTQVLTAFQGSNIRREYTLREFLSLSSMHCAMRDVTRGIIGSLLTNRRRYDLQDDH
jgi:hypothetical protein